MACLACLFLVCLGLLTSVHGTQQVTITCNVQKPCNVTNQNYSNYEEITIICKDTYCEDVHFIFYNTTNIRFENEDYYSNEDKLNKISISIHNSLKSSLEFYT